MDGEIERAYLKEEIQKKNKVKGDEEKDHLLDTPTLLVDIIDA